VLDLLPSLHFSNVRYKITNSRDTVKYLSMRKTRATDDNLNAILPDGFQTQQKLKDL
jgi:hypothetical protein